MEVALLNPVARTHHPRHWWRRTGDDDAFFTYFNCDSCRCWHTDVSFRTTRQDTSPSYTRQVALALIGSAEVISTTSSRQHGPAHLFYYTPHTCKDYGHRSNNIW